MAIVNELCVVPGHLDNFLEAKIGIIVFFHKCKRLQDVKMTTNICQDEHLSHSLA